MGYLVHQLAFQPVRGKQAVEFKGRAEVLLGHLPDVLQVSVLKRAVLTGGGMAWLQSLMARGIFLSSVHEFWEHFAAEFLPVNPKLEAYTKLIKLKQLEGMGVVQLVQDFRDV